MSACGGVRRVANLEPKTPRAVQDTLDETLGTCARSPMDMKWVKWAAATTFLMMRGAECSKIATVTNSLGTASWRGAAMRIIGVLAEMLWMNCGRN
mmetsp:Transcript_15172/g.23096  ORF Transcript_15172/g.23096 Transcript_15172/m.23096 type:complete len:96 (+) Transcript_15172:161-448(+)